MKRILPLLLSLLLLTGCGGDVSDGSYQQITQEAAKEMMDTQEVIILDVREQDEYDSGHIPDAILLPVDTIDEETAAAVIPDKESTVLVYCRSGNRSKTASSTLAELGYTDIYEFGGISPGPMRQSRNGQWIVSRNCLWYDDISGEVLQCHCKLYEMISPP